MSLEKLRFWRVLVVTWLGYAAYTMARRPFSVGRAAIERDTGMSKYASGMVDTAFLVSYTIGQLFYGSHVKGLASSKVILAGGLVGSAMCCAVVAVSTNTLAFVVAWGLNGAFQAAGWASCLTVVTPWLHPAERGVVMGLWGTNMAAGGVLGNTVTAYLIDSLGSWRAAIMSDVVVLLVIAVVMVVFLRRHPNTEALLTAQQAADGLRVDDVTRAPKDIEGAAILSSPISPSASGPSSHRPTGHASEGLGFRDTLAIPGVLGVSCSYFAHKLVRYSLMFWLPYLFARELGYTTAASGYIASVLDVGGVAGSILGGYFSDWYHGGTRRATAVMFFVAGMAISVAAFAFSKDLLASSSNACAAVAFFTGLNAFAIDSLMTSSLQQDLAERQGVAMHLGAISGVVGGIGTAGSILQGFITPYMSDQSWEALFLVLSALTLVAGAFMVTPIRLERKKVLASSV